MNDVTVCSVAPNEFAGGLNYAPDVRIPACPKGQSYAKCRIGDKQDFRIIYHEGHPDGLKKEAIPFDIPARQVAESVINCDRFTIEGRTLGLLEWEGVFIAESTTPTKEELEAARSKRRKLLIQRIREGDTLFGRLGPRAMEHIPDYCKRAVEEMGESREWVFVPVSTKFQCPACATLLTALADGSSPAICKTCGAILDRERAERFGLLAKGPETAQVAGSKGR